MALSYGIAPMEVKKALASFRGVERRMDIKYQSKTCCYIDDYAHHPEEIRATINSVKEWFPDREITGIFQPHLYTRTRDFADEFALSLSLLDRVILLPVYPARELPIPGVNSEMILKLIPGKNKMILEPSEVKGFLRKEKPSVLLTLGAGNIDRLTGTITDTLKELNA
jgi:UDP-N-acetylmuramate--alanine ligase